MSLNQANERQRFSIRKLTVGAASVLLGLAFLSVNGNQVHAAEGKGGQAAVVESNSNPNNKDVDNTSSAKTGAEESANAQAETTKASNTDAQANKAGGQGKDNASIVGVNDKNSVEYDYSISAKNKNSNQTEEVHSAVAGKINTADLNAKDDEDIEAHLTLKNVSEKDIQIGTKGDNNPNSWQDIASLMINSWTNYAGRQNKTLQVDTDKAANVEFNKDNALTVYYVDQNNKWLTYDEMVSQHVKDALSVAHQIGFKGVIPVGVTARLNVPLVVNEKGTDNINVIDPANWNNYNTRTLVHTINEPKTVLTEDQVANGSYNLTVRNNDGSYTLIDDSAFANELPKIGDVMEINNSGYEFGNNNTLYQGGTYHLNLAAIQAVLQKYGYSVNPDNTNDQVPVAYYSYGTKGGLKLTNPGQANQNGQSSHFFYVEVHKFLDTQDQTFEQGSNEAANFNASDLVNGVTNVENPQGTNIGYCFDNVAGNVSDAQIVSITNAQGQSVSSIDANTPAGTYTITVGYKLNGVLTIQEC